METPARAPEAILREALEAGHHARIAAVLDEHLGALITSDVSMVGAAVERLPADVRAASPLLDRVGELAKEGQLRISASQAVRFVTEVARGMGVEMLPPLGSHALLASQMMTVRASGDFAGAQALAAQLRPGAYEAGAAGARAHDMVALCLLQLGVTEILAGDFAQAQRDLWDARVFGAALKQTGVESDAVVKSALVHAALGRTAAAEGALNSRDASGVPSSTFAAFVENTESQVRALIAVERLDADAATRVGDALRRAENDELRTFATLALARLSTAHGDPTRVIDHLDYVGTFSTPPAGSLAAEVMAVSRVRALLLLGETKEAGRVLDTSTGAALHELPVLRARWLLLTGRYDEAATAARALVGAPGLGPTARAEAMLLVAWTQQLTFGQVRAETAKPLGAFIAREQAWRVLQKVPDEVIAQLPFLEARPPFERRLALPRPAAEVQLTESELDILHLLTGPQPLAAIARSRFVSLNTIKTQVSSIYRRLHVNGRREAVAEATRRGLLDPERILAQE